MPAERRRLILAVLRERGSISVGDIEDRFGVSSMTARRDLTVLADHGHIQRTHGGAVLPEPNAQEDQFSRRLEQHIAAKERLARAVVTTLSDGKILFVDSSTTSYVIAREPLQAGVQITLITKGIGSDGRLTDPDPLEASVKRAMISQSQLSESDRLTS
ncbi:MAG: DeoR/GlpR family DNA-binding transcription regulator [Solirubrobacteraceae bacterium]|jgi:DeoR family transcriptional regulator of aga operon